MLNRILIFSLTSLFLWSTPVNAKSAASQESKKLSSMGMAIVESWAGDNGVLFEADKLFKEALRIDPQNVEAITGVGRIATRRGYLSGDRVDPEALKAGLYYADKALSLDDKYVQAHFLRGSVLLGLRNINEAMKEADIIDSIDKSFCDRHTLRRGIYQHQQKTNSKVLDEAKQYLSCTQKTKNATQIKKGYRTLARVYMDIGENEKADMYFRKTNNIPPASAWDYDNHGIALLALGKIDKAEEMMKKAVSIMDYPYVHKHLADLYWRKAGIYEKEGDYQKAEDAYLMALGEDPDRQLAYLKLTELYFTEGKCERISEIYERCSTYKLIIKQKISECYSTRK